MRMVRAFLICATIALAAAQPGFATPGLYVYKGAGCTGRDELKQFSKFIGRDPDGSIEFFSYESWTQFHSASEWSLTCWDKKPRLSVVFSVPLLMKDGGTLAEGARGAYDRQFAALGRRLVQHGRGDAMLRLGWEFNGNWYPWSATRDPESFRSYFRRVVKVLRATPGADFRIVWNAAAGVGGASPENMYPGDDVVDIVGLDVYNQSWNPLNRSAARRWNDVLYHPAGLNWLREFAHRHSKPIAIPEWGTGTRPDGHGLGDDPDFITRMAAWMRQNKVIFQAYWDYPAPDYNAQLSKGRFPNAARAYRREFGTVRPPSTAQ